MSGQRHPDTDAIASLAAGFVSGLRARRLAAHVASCDRCAAVSEQLGAVSSMLASVPVPALQQDVGRQISAAIATEAAARAAAPSAADTTPAGVGADRGATGGLSPSPSPGPRHARSRGQGSLRLRPAMAIGPVVACLLAGFGYLLSHVGASSSSSEPVSAAAPHSSAAASSSASSGPVRKAEPANGRPVEAFSVVNSGIRYQAATLPAQVGGELKTVNDQQRGELTPVPSASATKAPVSSSAASGTGSAGGKVAAPSQTLVGCVLQVTGNIRPSLVDRAFYQGKPVYVIVVRDKAWVVGRGCTASDTELITSVSLTATP